jgi:hypothetical protein
MYHLSCCRDSQLTCPFLMAGFVQQIIMKAAVHPYSDQMQLTDAFR